MTFLLDAHLDPKLAAWLGARFKIVVQPVRELGLARAKDVHLFEAARRLGQTVIITKDYDFVELIQRRGSPPQVVWLRCPNMRTVRLQSLLSSTFANALARLAEGSPLVELTISVQSGR